MNCRKVTHLLSAYMDGELAGIESLQIRDHLTNCTACASEYNDLLHMKRLLGRLKVQAPREEITSQILQTIRIDTELSQQRTFTVWVTQLVGAIRSSILSPSSVGFGVGFAVVVVLLYTQSPASNELRVVGEWDHSIPPASEFTAGVRYPNPDRFIRSAPVRTPGVNSVEDVSYSAPERALFMSDRKLTSGYMYNALSH